MSKHIYKLHDGSSADKKASHFGRALIWFSSTALAVFGMALIWLLGKVL